MIWNGADGLRPLLVPIGELVPDPTNSREHDARNLAAIGESLRVFGQHRAAVAQLRPDGTKRVTVGNGMLVAAKALGWSHLAVLAIEESDAVAAARAVADNRAGELASWNTEALAATLGGLPDELVASLGFNDRELQELLGPPSGLCDPDEIPEPPAEPTSRRGDLYLLGEHRLLCGDSLNAADVARLLDGAKPELLVCDPPYGISLDGAWRDRAGLNALGRAEPAYMQRQEGHRNTTISGDTKADWSDAFELVPSLRVAYVWHASSFSVDVGAGLRRIGFDLRQGLLWVKPTAVLSRTHYWYQSEPCWYAVRHGATAAWIGEAGQSNVWFAPSPKALMNKGGATPDDSKQDHPTQKPLLCMETPLANHDLAEVYEPFGGSGTTVIACERRRKRCFAMEIDPKYVDVIVARWEAFTGKKAELVRA